MLKFNNLNNDVILHLNKFLSDNEIFSFLTSSKELYNFCFKSIYSPRLRNIFYIQFLFKYNRQKLLKEYEMLPYEIYEDHYLSIDHFDSTEYKDYSSGYRRICSERYYLYNEEKEELEINYENYDKFIELTKQNKYKEYKKDGKFIRQKKIKKYDRYSEKTTDKIIYYKYVKN